MNYMTLKETSEKWGISMRRIQTLCNKGKINGAIKFGKSWAIPCDSVRPKDGRLKDGRYNDWRKNTSKGNDL